ncbi:MAG: hypothetical protein WKG07_11850 [Hymenobacter sp.]
MNGVGANGGTDNIATGEGFFVRVAAAGTPGALTFKNSGRLTTYASARPSSAAMPPRRRSCAWLCATPPAALDEAAGVLRRRRYRRLRRHPRRPRKPTPAGAFLVPPLATVGAEALSIDARPALGTADVLGAAVGAGRSW